MIKIDNISETEEGKFLMMALAKITTESQTDKTPDEVLEQISVMVNEVYGSSLQRAMKILCEELIKDKLEGSYYYSWQCNIAMAFKDELNRHVIKGNKEDLDFHEIANQAAKNFLNILINQK